MERSLKFKKLFVVFICLFLISCSFFIGEGKVLSEKEIGTLAYSLKMISPIVSSEMKYGEKIKTVEDIKPYLESEDPKTYNLFSEYYLDFKIEEKNVIALVCDQDQQYMIAEDTSCTSQIDRQMRDIEEPCDFSLDLLTLCN